MSRQNTNIFNPQISFSPLAVIFAVSEITRRLSEENQSIRHKTLQEAYQKWKNNDSATTTKSRMKAMINETVELVKKHFAEILGVPMEEFEAFKKYMQDFCDNENHRKNTRTIMEKFCKAVIIISILEQDKALDAFQSFPPREEERKCQEGTDERIDLTIKELSGDAIIITHNAIFRDFASQLKCFIPEGNEIHIPPYLRYVLGIDLLGTRPDTLPQSDITSELMWKILREYPEKFLEKLNRNLSEKVEEKFAAIKRIVGQYVSDKYGNDINGLMNAADAQDEEAKTLRTTINTIIAPLTLTELIEYEESYSWKSDEEIKSAIFSKSIAEKKFLDEVKTQDTSIPPSAADVVNMEFLKEYKNLFELPASITLTDLLKSKSPEANLFAIEALWVMGSNFLCSSPVHFLGLMEGITHNLAIGEEEKWENIFQRIPKEHQFKVEQILKRQDTHKNDPLVGLDIEDKNLEYLIYHADSADLVSARIISHPDEFKALTEEQSIMLILHPQRMRVFEELKGKITKNDDALRKYFRIASTYKEHDLYQTLLDCFVIENKEDTLKKLLLDGIVKHDLEMVKIAINALVENKIELEEITLDGKSLMMMAVVSGDVKIVKYLAGINIDVNIARYDGATPLFKAILGDKTEMVRILAISISGADLNFIPRNSVPPLVLAVRKRNKEIVDILLEKGADPDFRVKGERTPLMEASSNGRIDIMELLLKKGAKLDLVDRNGANVVSISIFNQQLECTKFLLFRDGVNSKAHDIKIAFEQIYQKSDKYTEIKSLLKPIIDLQNILDRIFGEFSANSIIVKTRSEGEELKPVLSGKNPEINVFQVLKDKAASPSISRMNKELLIKLVEGINVSDDKFPKEIKIETSFNELQKLTDRPSMTTRLFNKAQSLIFRNPEFSQDKT